MTPEINAVLEFLKVIDPSTDPHTFQTFDDNKKRDDKRLARIFHGTIDQHFDGLPRLNALGAAVCFMVNKGDGKGRKNENVLEVRSLFVDLDKNTEVGMAKIEALPKDKRPHIIVESSPNRFHAYWLLAPGFPLESFVPALQQLAARFGGDDNICRLPQVMRLPGFYNHKHEQPFMTRVLRHG
jgi:hypothetical protein